MNLDFDQIAGRLEPYFHSRQALQEAAQHVLDLEPRWQDFALSWTESLASTQPEIASQFARKAASALRVLGRDECESWLRHALELFDQQGLYAAVQCLENLDQFVVSRRKRRRGLELAEIRGVLELFLRGLNGRRLELQPSAEILTDSENLFLPEVIDQFPDPEQNFACFRTCVVHLWAQCWYGTWRADTIARVPRREPMLRTFQYVESLRLNACLQRDYPGLARQMRALIPVAETWREIEAGLSDPDATVLDSIRLANEHWDKPRPDRFLYQGIIDPDRVQATLEKRLQREKQQFRLALSREASSPAGDGGALVLGSDGEHLKISIEQDLGELPAEYLRPLTDEERHAHEAAVENPVDEDALESGAYTYDEWDCRRGAHRKRWCVLREREIEPDSGSTFVDQTLATYRGQIKSLRRGFEVLRDEYRILKKQPDGENLDLDALVDAIADARSGREMTSRIYRKAHRVERDIAVAFMVDMSGSMKGWINRVQREALILIAEALETLDDRYAIYGFSGSTRKRCELYRIKSFDERYGRDVMARIAAIEPREFTRMGVTIRHLSQLLERVAARTKLLITLSDGRPYDHDNYSDDYAIEDTRMALFEARQRRIHPFCITIDEQARDYLPHMYGESNYVLVNDIDKLPCRISEIYRHLTR